MGERGGEDSKQRRRRRRSSSSSDSGSDSDSEDDSSSSSSASSDSDSPSESESESDSGSSDSQTTPTSEKDRRKKAKKDRKKKKKRRREEDSEDESDSDDEDDKKGKKLKKKKDGKDRDKKKKNKKKDKRKSKEKEKEKERDKRKDKKRSKKDKDKDKKRSRKKSKRREEGDDEKSIIAQAKQFLKAHGSQLDAPPTGEPPEDLITEDDYFLKNLEFSTWLKEYRRTFFTDLTSEQTHELFRSFMEEWNRGKLPPKYYAGMNSADRTGSGVWKGIRGGPADPADEEEAREASRALDKREKKKWKKEQDLALDEMLPKATGREALFEKKAARREANRQREDSPEVMRQSDLMGGGDDFHQRVAKQRAHRERRQAERTEAMSERLAAFQAAEQAKMEQLRAMVGLSGGGKITIPKRE